MTAPRALAVSTLAAAVVLSAGCGGGSNSGIESGEAGTRDATSSSSSGGSGGGSGSGSGSGGSSSGGGPGSSGGAGRDAGSDGGGSDGGADAGPPMPSCAPGGPGLSNCGGAVESCCTTLAVPGGTYDRTYNPLDTNGNVTLTADGGPTGEADPAGVSGFRLDKYQVTVGRFRQFVEAVLSGDGGLAWTPPAGSGKHTHLNGGNGLNCDAGWLRAGWVTSDNGNIAPTNANLACPGDGTWTDTPGSQENLPINCVNWYEAYAFCIWDGGFLPSEAEWEYAAAGGSQQREYPWGSTASGDANQYAIYDCYYPDGAPPDAAAGTPGTCAHVEHRAGRDGDAGSRAVGPARSGGQRVGVEPGLVRALRRSLHGLRRSCRGILPAVPGRQLRRRQVGLAPRVHLRRPSGEPPLLLRVSLRQDSVTRGRRQRVEAHGRA